MQRQLQQFEKQMKNGRLAQSFLVVGPEGTGKFSAVIKMVGLLNDLSDDQLVLAKKGELPDMILLETELEEEKNKLKNRVDDKERDRNMGNKKKNGDKKREKKKSDAIRKEQIDEAMKKIVLKNFQLKKKVIIIKRAEKLTDEAANGLLKLIEEPSDNLIIFLLVNNEEDVLATIKSRCQKIVFTFLSDEEIGQKLDEEFDLDEEQKQNIVRLAYGRIELARKYATSPEQIKKALKIRDDFRRSLREGKIQQLKLVEKVTTGGDDLLWVLNEWVWYLKIFLEQNIVQEQNGPVVKKVYDILRRLLEVRSTIKTSNVNPKVQLENFFIQI